MDMCDILSWTTMWAVLAVWEIMKMALMVVARYNFLFTRPRLLCSSKLGAMFRGILFSVIMLQCYISTGVWLCLLFVYFHNMQCGAVWQLVLIFVESLMNAICSFIGIYFNAKNRPHITLTKEEAKVMFKRLVDAVPEVKFELYSFKSTIKCKEMLEQDCWFENKESFHFSQLEKLLDIDSVFVALLKLEVRPYNNKDTIEEYRMVLYRFCDQNNFHLSDIQLLSIVEDSVPAMAIALTSHHSTRIQIVQDRRYKPNKGVWILCNILCPFFGTYRNWQVKDQCIRLSVVRTV